MLETMREHIQVLIDTYATVDPVLQAQHTVALNTAIENLLVMQGDDYVLNEEIFTGSNQHRELNHLSWGEYFPALHTEIYAKVFIVATQMVYHNHHLPCPDCPDCVLPMKPSIDVHATFGWRYRCGHATDALRDKKASTKGRRKSYCTNTLSPTTGTWFFHAPDVLHALNLMYFWICGEKVTDAIVHAKASPKTACRYYAMCQYVAAVINSNDVTENQFGGEDGEVEIDETFDENKASLRTKPRGAKASNVFRCYFLYL